MRHTTTMFAFLAAMTLAVTGGCPLDLSSLLGGLTGNTNTNTNANTNANTNDNTGGGGLTGDATNGQELYTSRCAVCHSLGTFDTSALPNTPDLLGEADEIVNDLGTIDEAMEGITLTDQEVADLKAFIDSL